MTLKITDLLISIDNNVTKYSIEVTPDINVQDLDSLTFIPLFISITWHARVHKCADLNIAPLRLATYLRKRAFNVLLHLSCDLMNYKYMDNLLSFLMSEKIDNLFIVLGENYTPDQSDFKSTKDLIKYVRQKTNKHFCIGVAGFPDNTETKHLQRLKDKIDAGADFVLTQAFFDAETYRNFEKETGKFGINKPLIPGIFPFQTYEQAMNFSRVCKVNIPESLSGLTDKSDANCLKILKDIMEKISIEEGSKIIHLFTLNKLKMLDKVV